MKSTKTKEKEKLYPIFFNDKWYKEKDCDDLFVAFYHTRFALGVNSSVYVGDKIRVCPDGSCEKG